MKHHARVTIALFCGLLTAPMALAQAPGKGESKPPAPERVAPCDAEPGFHALDFWLGEWDVFVGDTKVGTNRIEKILDGCAVTELWTDAEGHEGRSLFYYQAATDVWKQVWVTGVASRPGGLKEKQLVERLPDGGLRFQGTIPLAGGTSYLDRTTLTPLDRGRVRQLIEVSRDDGKTWTTGFDAVYVPRS